MLMKKVKTFNKVGDLADLDLNKNIYVVELADYQDSQLHVTKLNDVVKVPAKINSEWDIDIEDDTFLIDLGEYDDNFTLSDSNESISSMVLLDIDENTLPISFERFNLSEVIKNKDYKDRLLLINDNGSDVEGYDYVLEATMDLYEGNNFYMIMPSILNTFDSFAFNEDDFTKGNFNITSQGVIVFNNISANYNYNEYDKTYNSESMRDFLNQFLKDINKEIDHEFD